MTTITIERELLEQALNALSAPNHCVFSEPPICVDIRAALLAPATATEPVAYRYRGGSGGLIEWVTTTIYANAQAAGDYEPLFTHPAHTEAEVQRLLDCMDPDLLESFEPVVRRILGVPAP